MVGRSHVFCIGLDKLLRAGPRSASAAPCARTSVVRLPTHAICIALMVLSAGSLLAPSWPSSGYQVLLRLKDSWLDLGLGSLGSKALVGLASASAGGWVGLSWVSAGSQLALRKFRLAPSWSRLAPDWPWLAPSWLPIGSPVAPENHQNGTEAGFGQKVNILLRRSITN